jgi:hypothetical protein
MIGGNPDFVIGNVFEYGGIMYCVVKGRNADGDKILMMSFDGGKTWHMPTIAHGLIFYEFKCEVEENNYKRPQFMGDDKLKQAYEASTKTGWRIEARIIEGERSRLKTGV